MTLQFLVSPSVQGILSGKHRLLGAILSGIVHGAVPTSECVVCLKYELSHRFQMVIL